MQWEITTKRDRNETPYGKEEGKSESGQDKSSFFFIKNNTEVKEQERYEMITVKIISKKMLQWER